MVEESRYTRIMEKLKSLADPHVVAGMARVGIVLTNAYGVSTPTLRQLAKETGKDHDLAQELWSSGVYEARILASLIDEPGKVTELQMERWAHDFNSWSLCDLCCANLFDKTDYAYQKAVEWSARDEEYVKRAGFVLMAALAVHDKKAEDAEFVQFLPILKRESVDTRNFVKKAVNWALRQIGKRNSTLNTRALETANEIQGIESTSAHWIASDAIRELESEKVQRRLQR